MSPRLFFTKTGNLMGPTHDVLSIMKLIIFLIYTPLVYTELHTFTTTYTGVTGIPGSPEFFAVTTLDGQQMDYYDSITQKLIPKQKWLEEHVSADVWIEDTVIRRVVQEIYKNNIYVLMSRFNQTRGIHTYQRIYGCSWNSETDETDWFDWYGYDGEDFITLDPANGMYITPIPQGVPTIIKWNNNRAQIDSLQRYYKHECVEWLKYFLNLGKAALRTTAPQVSLLQNSIESLVSCYVTGFYPDAVMIYWMKNEEEQNEDVEFAQTLPNEDGTFQKTVTLFVRPEEWNKNQYICVVEHISLMEKIQKILNDDEIISNERSVNVYLWVIMMVMVMLLTIFIIVLFLKKCVLGHHKKLIDTCMQQRSDDMGFNKDA